MSEFKSGRWTKEEVEYFEEYVGRKEIKEIAEHLNRPVDSVVNRINQRGFNKILEREWAIYRGDELMMIGNAEECCKYLGINRKTLTTYGAPSREKRGISLVAVDIGKWRKCDKE